MIENPSGPSLRMSASVVICTYTMSRFDGLLRSVDAVRSQLGTHDDLVIVVDNAPDVLERCARHWPEATVVPNDLGRGLSSARNCGLKHSTGDVVVFLDDDACPRPGWLGSLLSGFADPAVAGVGGAVVPAWEALKPRWFPDEFGWVVGCDYLGLPAHRATIRNPIGANMALRTSVLEAVGGFSESLGRVGRLPSGGEETEISIRVAQRAAGRIVRDTEATVDHWVPSSRATLSYFVRRCWHEGRSKAALAGLVGSSDALSAERGYAWGTLPRAVTRYLFEAHGGLSRAAAVVLGAAATAAGYLTGRRRSAPVVPVPAAGDFEPIAIVDLDLDDEPQAATPNTRGQLAVLLRDRGWPLAHAVLESLEPGDDLVPRTLQIAGSAGRTRAPEAWPSDWHLEDHDHEQLVTVVVCTLGQEPLLRTTVEHVLSQSHHRLDVLVVDNAPATGRTASMLRHVDDPRLRIVDEPRRGLSVARNTGLAHAHGSIIAYTDDDAAPDPDWIARLCDAYRLAGEYGHSRVSLVTGLVLPSEYASQAQLFFEQAGGFGKGFDACFWSARPHADPLAAVAVRGPQGVAFPYSAGEFGSGNNMSFRTEVLRRLGGFDVALGAGTPARGGEDLDVFRTFYLAGETIVYVPTAIVRHRHRDDESALVEQMRGYGIGMSANLTKLALTKPLHVPRLLRRLPSSVRLLLDPGSGKNHAKTTQYPTRATIAELQGYLIGPWSYLRSRQASRRHGHVSAGGPPRAVPRS